MPQFIPIRILFSAVAFVCRKYAEKAIELNRCDDAVLPLAAASDKACENKACLNAVKADFLMVCLKAKTYEQAMASLDQ